MKNKVSYLIFVMVGVVCSLALVFGGISLLNKIQHTTTLTFKSLYTETGEYQLGDVGGTISYSVNGESSVEGGFENKEFMLEDKVVLSAHPNDGFEFMGFFGEDSVTPSETSLNYEIDIHSSMTIQAIFSKVYSLTLNIELKDGGVKQIEKQYHYGEFLSAYDIINEECGEDIARQYLNSAPMLESGDIAVDEHLNSFTMGATNNILKIKPQQIDNVGFSGGNGSASSPYLISTASDLFNAYGGAYYRLANNIDLNPNLTSVEYNASTGYIECVYDSKTYYLGTGRNGTSKGAWSGGAPSLTYWIPRGFGSGRIDGNNKTISGICINSPGASSLGLLSGANCLALINLSTRNSFIIGADYVAGYIGSASGGGYAGQGLLNRTIVVGNSCVGGVCGFHNCIDFKDCENYGTIISTGSGCGGICGDSAHCGLINCGNYGNIYGNGCVGGLIGRENAGCNCSGFKVKNSVNSGYVTGNSNTHADFGWKVYGSGWWYNNLFYLAGSGYPLFAASFTIATASATLNTLNNFARSSGCLNWFIGKDGLPHIIQNAHPEVIVNATRATVTGGEGTLSFQQSVTLKVTPDKGCIVIIFKINGYMQTLKNNQYTDSIMEDWEVEVIAVPSNNKNLRIDGSSLSSKNGNGTITFVNLEMPDSAIDLTIIEYFMNIYEWLDYNITTNILSIFIDKLDFVNNVATIPSVLFETGVLYIDTTTLIGTRFCNSLLINGEKINDGLAQINTNGETTIYLETDYAVHSVTINGSVYPTVYSYQNGSLVANGSNSGSVVSGKKVYFMLTVPASASELPSDIEFLDCVILISPAFGYTIQTVSYKHGYTSKTLNGNDYNKVAIKQADNSITVTCVTKKSNAEPTKVRVTVEGNGGHINGASQVQYDTVVGNTYGGINVFLNTNDSALKKTNTGSSTSYSKVTDDGNNYLKFSVKKSDSKAMVSMPYDKSLSTTINYTIVAEVSNWNGNNSYKPKLTVYDPSISTQLVSTNGSVLSKEIPKDGIYIFPMKGTLGTKDYFFAPYVTCNKSANIEMRIRFSVIIGGLINNSENYFSYVTPGSSLTRNFFSSSKTGYKFDRWVTMFGDTVTSTSSVQINTDHTISARWNSEMYTITFNPNGGTVSPATKNGYYGKTYGRLPEPTYRGRTFLGWFTNASGGAQYNENDIYSVVGNQTLYAHWKLNTSLVTYYNEKNSLGTSQHTFSITDPLLTFSTLGGSVSSVHAANGWTFAGWTDTCNTSSVVEPVYYDGQDYITPDDGRAVSMYAVYKRTVSFKSGVSGSTPSSGVIQYWNTYDNSLVSSVKFPAFTPIENWTPCGWSAITWEGLDINESNADKNKSIYFTNGKTSIKLAYNEKNIAYAVYSRVLNFHSGSKDYITESATQYLNCANNLLTSVVAPQAEGETLAGYEWRIHGWRHDTTADKKQYDARGYVATEYEEDHPDYYAIYARTALFTYFYGTNDLNGHGSQTIEGTQYLNSKDNAVSVVEPQFVEYDLIKDWKFQGYREDKQAIDAVVTKDKPIQRTITFNSTMLSYNYYAVYTRYYVGIFYSDEDKKTSVPIEMTRYYNSGDLDETSETYALPTTLPVTMLGRNYCRNIVEWVALGWKSDENITTKQYDFEETVWLPFETTDFYAVYSYSYTSIFYSGTNCEQEEEVSAVIYYNSSITATPENLILTTPDITLCAEVPEWTAVGYRSDVLVDDKTYGFAEEISVAKHCVKFYAVYKYHYVANFNSGENTEGKSKTTVLTKDIYYNTFDLCPVTEIDIKTPNNDDLLVLPIEFWTKSGWRDDEITTDKNYSFDQDITVSLHTTIFYAIYYRDYTAYFFSGIEKEQSTFVDAERTFFNASTASVPVSVKIISPGTLQCKSITSWRAVGWNDNETAEEPKYEFGKLNDFYFHITDYYAVYSRTHYVSFYSGINHERNSIKERAWYFNSSQSSVPGTATVTTATETEIGLIDNWTPIGWRSDEEAKEKQYEFGRTIEIPFTVATFYAVYKFEYRGVFYSGDYKRAHTNFDVDLFYSSSQINLPTQVTIQIPTKTNTYDIENWNKLGYRDDELNGSQLYNFGETREVYLESSTFYTVYSTNYTATFLSGVNSTNSGTVSAIAYYSSANKDKSSSVTIKFPSKVQCASLGNYEKLGWRGDTKADDPEFGFEEEVTVNFDVVTFYAVYSYTSTMKFISGLNATMEKTISIQVYSNTFDTTPPVATTITMPSEDECEGINNWNKAGWRRDSKTEKADYKFGERYDNIILDTIFYAVYTRDLVVHYDANGAEGETPDSVIPIYLNSNAGIEMSSQVVVIAECTFVKNGYYFKSWAEGNVNGKKWNPGEEIHPDIVYSASSFQVDMFAIWEGNSYKVVYYNGSTLVNDSSHVYGQLSPLLTWEELNIIEYNSSVSWVFCGWATNALTTRVSYTDGEEVDSVTINPSCNLYAVYSRTIRFLAGDNASVAVSQQIQYWNPCGTSLITNISGVEAPDVPALGAWTPMGWRQDVLASSGNLLSQSINIYPSIDKQATLYGVYERTIVMWSCVGEAGEVLDGTATQILNSYNNTVSAITTLAPVDNSIMEEYSWYPIGYRQDGLPEKENIIGLNSVYAPPFEASNALYAVYERQLKDIYRSGINKSTIVEKTALQFFNTQSKEVSISTSEYVAPVEVEGWNALGYREDEEKADATMTNSVGKQPDFNCDVSEVISIYNAVYKRTYQAKFFMGLNSTNYIEKTAYAFYNTVFETTPEEVTLTTPTIEECPEIINWEGKGFRTDIAPDVVTHRFDTTYNDVIYGSNFYSIYSRILSVIYYANGDEITGEMTLSEKAIYASAGGDSTSDQTIELKDCGYNKRGHSFVSWIIETDDGQKEYVKGTKYNPQFKVTDSFEVYAYAKWEINKYNITLTAGSGIAKLSVSAWDMSGESVTNQIPYNTQITLNIVNISFKDGYSGYEWILESGDGLFENPLYTVAIEDSVFVVNATHLATPTLSIQGTTQQVYGASDIDLTASNSTIYANDVSIYYKLGLSDGVNPYSYEGSTYSLSTILTVIKDSHVGARYYKVKAYATNGVLSSEESESLNTATITLILTQVTLSASENGGQVVKSTVYTKYNTANTFDLPTSSTPSNMPSASKTGYTFVGWFTSPDSEGKQVVSKSGIVQNNIDGYTDLFGNYIKTEPYTLYAHFAPNDFTVEFNANGGQGKMSIQQAVYDSPFTLPSNQFTKVGYSFDSWNINQNGSGRSFSDCEENVTNLTSIPDGSVVLYAQWKPNVYTVTFDLDGGTLETESVDVTFDAQYGELPIPEKQYYTFVNWSLDENEITNATIVKMPADHTLKAVWRLNRSTLIINPNGGTYIESEIYRYEDMDYNTEQTVIKPVREGYNFTGWTLEDYYNSEGTPNGYFSYNQETDNYIYTFGPKNGVIDLAIANWEPIHYQIKFDKNTESETCLGEMQNQEFIYDELQQIAYKNFDYEGYVFMHWNTIEDDSGTPYENQQEVINLIADDNAVITLYAIWEPIKYTVLFNANCSAYSSELSLTQEFTYDIEAELRSNEYIRTGYDFEGWTTEPDGSGTHYNDKASVLNLTNIQNNTVILYAKWGAKTVKITLENTSDDCSYIYFKFGTNMYYSDSTCETPVAFLTKPTLTGYEFGGYFTEGQGSGTQYINQNCAFVNDMYKNINASTTLPAYWIPHTYTVNYRTTNGELIAAQEYKYNERVNTDYAFLTHLVVGHSFAYWSTETAGSGTKYYPLNEVYGLRQDEGDWINLYANWEPNNYTVTFYPSFTTPQEAYSQNFVYGVKTNLQEVKFERTGYNFAYWTVKGRDGEIYLDKAEVENLITIPDYNLEFDAVWTPQIFTVTLDAGEAGKFSDTGEQTKIVQVTYDSNYGDLPVPVAKNGNATFLYWINPFDEKAIASNTKVYITEDTEISAKWVGMPYSYHLDYSHIEVKVTCEEANIYWTNQESGYLYGLTTAKFEFTVENGYTPVELYINLVSASGSTEITMQEIINNDYMIEIDVASSIVVVAKASMSVPDGLKFWVDTETMKAYVKDYKPNEPVETLTIPDTISISDSGVVIAGTNYNVVGIMPYAFSVKIYDEFEKVIGYNAITTLKEIIIPKSITIIEEGAFKYCEDLEKIVILNTQTLSICADAFSMVSQSETGDKKNVSLYIGNEGVVNRVGYLGEVINSYGAILSNVKYLYILNSISQENYSEAILEHFEITGESVEAYGNTYNVLEKIEDNKS